MVDKNGYFRSISGHLLNVLGVASIFIVDLKRYAYEWEIMYKYALKKLPKRMREHARYLFEDFAVWHVIQELTEAISYAKSGVKIMPFIRPEVIQNLESHVNSMIKRKVSNSVQ
jgi:hypothetical protein